MIRLSAIVFFKISVDPPAISYALGRGVMAEHGAFLGTGLSTGTAMPTTLVAGHGCCEKLGPRRRTTESLTAAEVPGRLMADQPGSADFCCTFTKWECMP